MCFIAPKTLQYLWITHDIHFGPDIPIFLLASYYYEHYEYLFVSVQFALALKDDRASVMCFAPSLNLLSTPFRYRSTCFVAASNNGLGI